MGKNQSASGLTNVIQYSNGNITFVSGSTTLMSISSSGAITTTGVISGSNALSASYAANADTLASSFVAFSSSILAQTASFNAFSASIYTATSSFSGRVGALESYTASLNLKTASFATTGSNTFIGTQTISGSVLQSGSFTSTGTLTAQTLVVQTITSSVVYSSGSNIFGNAIANTQTFTGSMNITGSNIFANVGIACFAGRIYIGTDKLCWTDTAFKTIQVGNGAFNNTSNQTQIVNNIYYDDTNYRNLIAGAANRIIMNTAGDFSFEYACATISGSALTLSSRFYICGINGRVGIGENAPLSSLVVATPSDTTSLGQSGIVIEGTSTLTAGCVMALSFTAIPGTIRARAAVGSVVGSDWGKGNLTFYTRDASDGTALTTADERMRIASDGNVGIKCTSPGVSLVVGTTDALKLPTGTTAQRPTGTSGLIRMNSTTGQPEWYDSISTSWVSFASQIGTCTYDVQYLVVGGGGGGGFDRGGAGGAGGYRLSCTTLISSTSYYAIIGAGGAGSVFGIQGGGSSFNGIASIGGGAGGSGNNTYAGTDGGSGGGGGNSAGGCSNAGGAGTTGQGNAGGSGVYTAPNYGAGGGGGAGAVGANGTSLVSGNGGVGCSNSICGVTRFYAGGGGAGNYGGGGNGDGGNGGGGNGVYSGTACSGTANSGGGGGSVGTGGTGGSGGSGIVIIRYCGSQRGTGGTVVSCNGHTIHIFSSSTMYTA